MRSITLATTGLVMLATNILGIDKETVLAKYRNKFVVATNEGLSTGICDGTGLSARNLGIDISSLNDVRIMDSPGCGAEPVHKGEVLKVFHIAFHYGYLFLFVENVSPHSVTRGMGAFAHQSVEHGRAGIRVRAGSDGKDLDAADTLTGHWLKPFDSPTEAAKFGNTAAGVFVNQVKAGMFFAEVEGALGLPQTRVDLSDKVLYKYKDMTIEFRDGKVADVR